LEYSPSEIKTTVKGESITISEETNYPFEDVINFKFAMKKPVTIPLQLRIPAWCTEAIVTLNGKALRTAKGGQIITLEQTWKDKDILMLQLPMEVTTSNWAKNSRAVERGPLVYALKLGERWEKGNEPTEGDYFSIYPTEAWNYGILQDAIRDPKAKLQVTVRPVATPFVWNQQHAPITITAPARKIPDWKIVNGIAHQPITTRTNVYQGETGKEIETISLIPYGCTKVRVVAFPVVK
jgi:hypothetical protein